MIEIEEIPVERIDEFWEIHIRYLIDDLFINDDEITYFSGAEYRETIQRHMRTEPNRLHMICFLRQGVRIGAAQYKTYLTEDGKCFILDFWVFPKYRGKGTGRACFAALEAYTKADGAAYYALNSSTEKSIRFWESLGFVANGVDEYNEKLFIRK